MKLIFFLEFFDEADIFLEFSSSDDDDDDDKSKCITTSFFSFFRAISVVVVLFPRFKLAVRTTGVSVETQITDE